MKTITFLLSFVLLGGAALAFAPSQSQADASKLEASAQKAEAAIIAQQLPSYPLTTCPISGEELGSMGDPLDLVTEGRLIRLCCKGCLKKAKADPSAAFAAIDAAGIKAQAPSYPFDTCVVSGEPLTANGKPVDKVFGTRLARFCCNGCVKAFKKDPAKFVAKIDEGLIKAQLPKYPLTTCVVSGEELGDDPTNFLYGTRLVRTCCKRCAKAFKKDPAKFVARLDEK